MTSVTTTGPDRSIWTLEDESRLVQFLLDHHAEAGDGANFKASLWNAAGEELSKHVTKGGPKTAASCKSKWDRLKKSYQTVTFLKNLSGFTWDEENGIIVTPATKCAWLEITKQNKQVSAFAGKGFKHYNDMNTIMPSVARGSHAFRPSNQSQGPVHSLIVANTANDNLNDISDNSGTELPPLSSPPTTSPPALPSPSPSASATAFISNNSILSSIAPSASASTSISAPASAISETSINGKRKRSAVDDELIVSPSQAGSRGKGRTSGGTFVLQGIKGEMETFNEALRERGQHRPLSESQRKSKAMEQLHDLELDDDRLIAIMQLFKSDADAADMFVAMKRESTRKSWVQSELAKLGFADTDTRMQD